MISGVIGERVCVLDGGLATEVEARGVVIEVHAGTLHNHMYRIDLCFAPSL